jgi:hypothetical protein
MTPSTGDPSVHPSLRTPVQSAVKIGRSESGEAQPRSARRSRLLRAAAVPLVAPLMLLPCAASAFPASPEAGALPPGYLVVKTDEVPNTFQASLLTEIGDAGRKQTHQKLRKAIKSRLRYQRSLTVGDADFVVRVRALKKKRRLLDLQVLF